jgi:hypothetical protein
MFGIERQQRNYYSESEKIDENSKKDKIDWSAFHLGFITNSTNMRITSVFAIRAIRA